MQVTDIILFSEIISLLIQKDGRGTIGSTGGGPGRSSVDMGVRSLEQPSQKGLNLN